MTTARLSLKVLLLKADYCDHTITGDPSKQDLRSRQKPIYSSIFTSSIWSYLLSSSVVMFGRARGPSTRLVMKSSERRTLNVLRRVVASIAVPTTPTSCINAKALKKTKCDESIETTIRKRRVFYRLRSSVGNAV